MSRGFKDTEDEIRNAIKKSWEEKGWSWDTHIGQACIRLLPIVSSIMQKELIEFKSSIEALSDTIDIAEINSEQAKDAVMLYKALKRSGMEESGLSYAIYAFLIGDKNAEYCPDVKLFNKQEQSK